MREILKSPLFELSTGLKVKRDECITDSAEGSEIRFIPKLTLRGFLLWEKWAFCLYFLCKVLRYLRLDICLSFTFQRLPNPKTFKYIVQIARFIF